MGNAFAATASFHDKQQPDLAQRQALIAAAKAAVVWARTQRTARPIEDLQAAARAFEPEPSSLSLSPLLDVARSAGGASLTAARGARSATRVVWSTAGNVAGAARDAAVPILRVLPRVAGLVALVAVAWIAVVKGRPYWQQWKAPAPITRTVPRVAETEPAAIDATSSTKKRTGRLVVNSANDVAQVFVDGKVRGITPLTLDGLAAGKHLIRLENPKGSVEQTVTVGANETLQVDQNIYPGWVSIVAPIDLTISEGTRSIRLDDRSQVMLSPGPHELLFENRALGYQEMRHIEVRPGETAQLSIAPPKSKATFTATAPADVWIDGTAVGQTPLLELPVEVGTHHVRMKSGAAERQFTVTATMTPLVFNVDFSQ